jgi:hypothetical protein
VEVCNGQSGERSDSAQFFPIALQNRIDRLAAEIVAREPSWSRIVGDIKVTSSQRRQARANRLQRLPPIFTRVSAMLK